MPKRTSPLSAFFGAGFASFFGGAAFFSAGAAAGVLPVIFTRVNPYSAAMRHSSMAISEGVPGAAKPAAMSIVRFSRETTTFFTFASSSPPHLSRRAAQQPNISRNLTSCAMNYWFSLSISSTSASASLSDATRATGSPCLKMTPSLLPPAMP